MSKISVIIPAYNHAEYIEEAINSVLNQTYPVYEIIVVDDGSTDNTLEVLEKFKKIIIKKNKHQGHIQTINDGLKMVTGDFIAFIDADDVWVNTKNEVQLNLLNTNPDVDIVFGYCHRFKTSKTENEYLNVFLDVMPGTTRVGGLFRKSVFEKVVYNLGDNRLHSFLDWYSRVKEANIKSLTHSEVVFYRRIHDKNEGIREKDSQRNKYFATIKAKLNRQRNQQ